MAPNGARAEYISSKHVYDLWTFFHPFKVVVKWHFSNRRAEIWSGVYASQTREHFAIMPVSFMSKCAWSNIEPDELSIGSVLEWKWQKLSSTGVSECNVPLLDSSTCLRITSQKILLGWKNTFGYVYEYRIKVCTELLSHRNDTNIIIEIQKYLSRCHLY